MGAAINYYRHTSTVKDYWNMDQRVDTVTYCTDDFVDQALNILDTRQRTNDSDPFFTWLSFNVPHAAIQAWVQKRLTKLCHFNRFSESNGELLVTLI